jgi:hypothetical protein
VEWVVKGGKQKSEGDEEEDDGQLEITGSNNTERVDTRKTRESVWMGLHTQGQSLSNVRYAPSFRASLFFLTCLGVFYRVLRIFIVYCY